VGESVSKPLDYYRTNVAKTVELLAAMGHHNVRYFIFSSTAAVYGEPRASESLREDSPCLPTNPYGATKLAVERMLLDNAAAGDFRYVTLRYFNAAGADPSGKVGERHHPETHLIPLVLKVATGERQAIQIYGTNYPTQDGTCIRDYVHVCDLTQAHLLALENLLKGGSSAVYNLGNNKGYSVREVIEAARRITRHSIPAVEAERRAGDPAFLVADSGKIRRELGWKPRHEKLEAIIETAWAWHQKEAARNTR
jgi:UDP-glucose 4-epimerase